MKLLLLRLFFRLALGFLWLLGLFRFLGCLWFLFRRFAGAIFFLLGGGESFLQSDHVFAGTERVESFGFLAQLFFGVVRRFDRQPDAALNLVHLDDARFDFLADLENVFHFRDVVFA